MEKITIPLTIEYLKVAIWRACDNAKFFVSCDEIQPIFPTQFYNITILRCFINTVLSLYWCKISNKIELHFRIEFIKNWLIESEGIPPAIFTHVGSNQFVQEVHHPKQWRHRSVQASIDITILDWLLVQDGGSRLFCRDPFSCFQILATLKKSPKQKCTPLAWEPLDYRTTKHHQRGSRIPLDTKLSRLAIFASDIAVFMKPSGSTNVSQSHKKTKNPFSILALILVHMLFSGVWYSILTTRIIVILDSQSHQMTEYWSQRMTAGSTIFVVLSASKQIILPKMLNCLKWNMVKNFEPYLISGILD